jgi:IS5 family transposase
MKGKLPSQEQRNIFRPILIEIINPNHKLVLLSAKMEWKLFENEFGQLYSNTGKPGVPIRIMVGLMILKIIYNLGDVAVMEQWIQNPYFQYFCGESEFQWKFPCDPSDLVYFRKRIGTQGAELIYKMTASLHEFRLGDSMADTSEPLGRNSYFEDNKILGRIIKLFKK